MMDTTVYEFNVQIWEEDGEYHYGICQEFATAKNDDSFEFIESGAADTLEQACALAADGIRRFFA